MDFIVLVGAAFGTAIISGTMGMGGGILLLAVMANYISPKELIPIHGLVQLMSNSSRAFLSFSFINKKLTALFFAGALMGAILGKNIVIALPEKEFRLVLSGFILFMTWAPRPRFLPKFKGKFIVLGGVATFMSLFVGATGPFIAPFFLHENLEKRALVATKAATQICVHLLKVLVFINIGFSVGEYLPLVSSMIVAVFLGNWVGRYCMDLFSEKDFRLAFRVIVTLLASRMIWQAFTAS